MKKQMLALLVPSLFSAQALAAAAFTNQQQLETFAAQANFQIGVVSNFQANAGQSVGRITLTLPPTQGLPAGAGNWQLYFHSVARLTASPAQAFTLTHINGDLYQLKPTAAFAGVAKGDTLVFNYQSAPGAVSYSDFMPRAFITTDALTPAVFKNTDTEDLTQFVTPFTKPEQQYRYQNPKDLYPIATAASRYATNAAVNQPLPRDFSAADQIIPTPKLRHDNGDRTLLDASWQIAYQGRLKSEANYLRDRLQQAGLTLVSQASNTAGAKQILLQVDASITDAESYQLSISDDAIVIKGHDNTAVFYGVQSLLSLAPAQFSSVSLPQTEISDSPRYRWRGMHYDMGRNFHGKVVTLRLIEQMARYKMNKLHLHLTEDEGWRIEIPGLPELTEIGSNRCFDLTEQRCLLTQLGTGPHTSGSGNGYYSKADFIEILQYAAARHIEVIPEIDMPGHARAAIKSMEVRYNRLMKQGKPELAKQYLLSDPNDKSRYMTVQNYTDNSVNVCMESSYAFIDKVVYELQQMYRQAGVRLTTYHVGGDEVGAGSWTASPQCEQLFAKGIAGVAGVADLKPYFVSRVADLLHKRQLTLGGWEDGLMYDPNTPFNRAQFANDQVYANVWDNIWEWGVSDRAYRLANAGYKVVMSHGTHLYLDHPYETHPLERGYYWAARYIDTQKIFNYMPDHVYANADKTRSGEPIKDLEQLLGRALPALEKPENILGMQGQVWTETIRTAEQLEQMLYPRLLPIAERAWHQAEWESATPDLKARDTSWQQFARVLADKELAKLSAAGVRYQLPTVGAQLVDGMLSANVAYPGLTIEYSIDQGQHWQVYQQAVSVGSKEVWLRSRSTDGRTSRVEMLK